MDHDSCGTCLVCSWRARWEKIYQSYLELNNGEQHQIFIDELRQRDKAILICYYHPTQVAKRKQAERAFIKEYGVSPAEAEEIRAYDKSFDLPADSFYV